MVLVLLEVVLESHYYSRENKYSKRNVNTYAQIYDDDFIKSVF